MEELQKWSLYHLGILIGGVFGAATIGWFEGKQLALKQSAKDTSVKVTTQDETKKPLPKAEAALLRRDPVAYPTVMLLIFAISMWSYTCYAFIQGSLPWYVAIVVNTLAVYISFTVAHDAAHGAVIPKSTKMNDMLGTIAGIPILAPFSLFKIVHLTHHRYSGDHDSAPDGSSLDPDAWAGEGPILLLPFRWGTVFVHYIRFAMRVISWRSHSGCKTKVDDTAIRELFVVAVLLSGGGLYCHYYIHPTAFSVCVLIPQFFGVAWLMYFFDYVPHRPHVIPYREDPYKATNATSLLQSTEVESWWWTAVCLGQNMHCIHHIWPSVPFYRYRALWIKYGPQLIDNGVRVTPLLIDTHTSRVNFFPELNENNKKTK